jgi:acyl-CoA thioesterase I
MISRRCRSWGLATRGESLAAFDGATPDFRHGLLAVGVAVSALAALGMATAACRSGSDAPRDVDGSPKTQARASATQPADGKTGDARQKIVILGDSLTAGLGLRVDQAYPTLLQRRLTDEGLNYEVVNAGVSGDTSAGGLSRLDWALQGNVRVLLVALGGNDGLRGLPVEQLRQNLASIIERAQARGIRVILAGMEAPRNYGDDYIDSFHEVYPALARKYNVALVPFLLQGVAGSEVLNQADGIHPTAAGARIVADNVWAVLEPLAAGRRRESPTGRGSPRVPPKGEGHPGS